MGLFGGSFWGPKSTPPQRPTFTIFYLVFDLAIYWSQDGSKTVPRGLLGGGLGPSWAALGPSWAGLGPLLGALGPSLDGLGGLLGRLEGVLGRSWGLLGPLETVLAAHEAINGSFWVVLEFDSLIQFIDSIS